MKRRKLPGMTHYLCSHKADPPELSEADIFATQMLQGTFYHLA